VIHGKMRRYPKGQRRIFLFSIVFLKTVTAIGEFIALSEWKLFNRQKQRMIDPKSQFTDRLFSEAESGSKYKAPIAMMAIRSFYHQPIFR